MELCLGLGAFVVMYLGPIVAAAVMFRRSKDDVFDGKPSKEQDD
jgi:hypothetical protein